MELDKTKLKKLILGERAGTAATIFCFIVTAVFIALFSTALAVKNDTLRVIALSVCPALLLAAICVAAFCNLKYGVQKDRLLESYIRSVLIENAPLLRPERNSLTFYITVAESRAEIKVNAYKEKIGIDLSAMGRLSAIGKSGIATVIIRTLSNTFCKLYERGGEYSDVSYVLKSDTKEKPPIGIIINGEPDRKCYKEYLKSKNI